MSYWKSPRSDPKIHTQPHTPKLRNHRPTAPSQQKYRQPRPWHTFHYSHLNDHWAGDVMHYQMIAAHKICWIWSSPTFVVSAGLKPEGSPTTSAKCNFSENVPALRAAFLAFVAWIS